MDQDYYVIGELTNGEAVYISRHRHVQAHQGRAARRADALRLPLAVAEDMVQRLHRVQAEGRHHQDVLLYRVARAPQRRHAPRRHRRRMP
jgi:hypothetical protein